MFKEDVDSFFDDLNTDESFVFTDDDADLVLEGVRETLELLGVFDIFSLSFWCLFP